MKEKIRKLLIKAFEMGLDLNFGYYCGVSKVWRRTARMHKQFDKTGHLRETAKAKKRWQNSGRYVLARKLAAYLVASGQQKTAVEEITSAIENKRDVNRYLYLH